jgi:TolB-like protein
MNEATSAIFVSYTSQDADAVRRLCEALRAAGLVVWFDQNELRGGDAWDASIRRQIRDCALFMPVISANTEARPEGYFRLEWRLAIERFNLMADDHAFLMPVVIDGTDEATARVPDRFRERQWTRLAGGEPSPAFIEQVRRTLDVVSGKAATPHGIPAALPYSRPARHNRTSLALVMGAIVVAATLGVGITLRNSHAPVGARTTTASSAVAPQLDPKSIAVLPFVNLTGKAEDAYLADGLQEEILSALARMRDLRVISRTSVTEYRGFTPNIREVGDRLGVGSVLEGSVRREGHVLRLTVQLIDARNDRHVLAADYDRDLGHLLGLQSEVARKLADALSVTLSTYERGELERVSNNNGDAYNLYLRAIASGFIVTPGTDPDLASSRVLLTQALRLDPQYTDALALLSQTCTRLFRDSQSEADGDCARKNFERAIALDPQSPEALLARGLYEVYVAPAPGPALADLEAVVRVRPNSSHALVHLGLALRHFGRFHEGLPHFERAWELDPLNTSPAYAVLFNLYALRRYPEFAAASRIMAHRFPAKPYWHITVARTECRVQHSLEPLRQAMRQYGGTLSAVDRIQAETLLARLEGRYLDAAKLMLQWPIDSVERDLRLGFLYWAGGSTEAAQRRFRSVESSTLALLKREPADTGVRPALALAQSMLGEHTAALAAIDAERKAISKTQEEIDGPDLSFWRSVILVRAGHTAEGDAEIVRLLRVPFGAPADLFDDGIGEKLLMVKDDRHFDEIVHNPPRL